MKRLLILLICLCITGAAFGQACPIPKKPMVHRFLPAIAGLDQVTRDTKVIRLSKMRLYFDKLSSHDQRWYRAYKRDMVKPWVETIKKTKRYHDASDEGKKSLVCFAEAMQARVDAIKGQIDIEVHPQALDLGYRIGSESFVKLPRGKHPYPTFWIHFFEFHYQDYSWVDEIKYFKVNEKKKEQAYWASYFKTWVMKWVKTKKFKTYGDVEPTPDDFYVVWYPGTYYTIGSFYCTNCYTDDEYYYEWDLLKEGFNPPAMAEKRPPKKLDEPSYLLLGSDDLQ